MPDPKVTETSICESHGTFQVRTEPCERHVGEPGFIAAVNPKDTPLQGCWGWGRTPEAAIEDFIDVMRSIPFFESP